MPAMLTYAIGDIHGSYTKLRNLLDRCTEHRGATEYRIVFLGDYIDRGPGSQQVVELLINTQSRAPDRVTCLRGNHEDMLLNAVHSRRVERRTPNEGAVDVRLREQR